MASDLKKKTLSGMIWSFVQRFGTMAISFVSNIVLARLLTPDDYGTIGMLMIFIAVANTFVDGGFGAALIQKKEPTKEDYSTIFWWNMFLSVVLYGLLFIGAPAVARFYNLPLLCDVLRVQGFVLIVNALSIIQQNQLRKQFKFKRLAMVTVISATLSAGIAIILAYMGWGVWALVAQQLMLSGFTTILLWILNKWYPLLIFSKESFKQLFGFGGFILGSNLINTLCNEIQGLLIGRFFSPATLGYYTQAYKLEQVTSKSLSSVIDQVTFPILTEYQNDNNALKNMFKKLSSAIAFVTAPIMLIMILIARPAIVFLYSDKWLPSVHYFQILCIAGIAVCLQNISYQAVASKGKSKDLFVWTIIKRIIGIVIIVLGMLLWEMDGLIWGVTIAAWFLLGTNLYLVSKHINYSLIQQLRDIFPILTLAIFVFIVTYCVNTILPFDIYANAFYCIIIYVLLYLGIAYTLKISILQDIRQLVIRKTK